MKDTTPTTRVAFCEQAGHEVLQELVTTSRDVIRTKRGFKHVETIYSEEWLCLHNGTKQQDLEEVKQFKNRNDGSN